MVERDEKVEEASLNVLLLAQDSQQMARLRAQVAIQDVVLTAKHVAMLWSTETLKTISRDHASLWSELDALQAVGRRREGVSRDCLERVCTG